MSEILNDNDRNSKITIAEMIGSYISNKQLSLRVISEKTGIYLSNLSKCLSGKTALTLPNFLKIIAAVDDDEVYEWMGDLPLKRYLSQSVRSASVCSTTDYAYLIILLKDYYVYRNEHKTENILNTIFSALAQQLFAGSASDNMYKENNARFEDNLYWYFCSAFYDTRAPLGFVFPARQFSDHQLGMLMSTGGTVIWEDARYLISWYQEENKRDEKIIKSRNVLNRIKYTTVQNYKIEDLLAADTDMQMNGIFFSACCLAEKNQIILNTVCAKESEYDSEMFGKIEYGVSSFFSCLRILEQNSERNQNLQDFWTFFRQTAADSPYHMAQLRYLSEEMLEYFPEKPLRFYK